MTDHRENPFPGLRPFEPEEDYLFFGRETQTRELLRRLRRTRFLAVVGTSGSGKSSLVKAGLLPALHGGMMSGEGGRWRIAAMRPGGDPIAALAAALASPQLLGPPREGARGVADADQSDQQAIAIQTSILRTTLRRGTRGLVDAVAERRLPSTDRLLLVVDQFEELFRFHDDGATDSDAVLGADATAFVRLLLAAARDTATGTEQRDGPAIYIVITMRSDFLGDCAQFRDLPEAINEGQYLIPRLTRDERRKAITGPVAIAGARIEARLVRRLLNDVGDNPDQLPILQHALMRTWDQAIVEQQADTLDLADYEAIGGMADALNRHAEKVYAELADDHARELTARLFKALTELDEHNRSRRRPCRMDELCRVTGATPEVLCRVIEAFRLPGRTFLMPPHGTSIDEHSVIDISHESLMRLWQRLEGWIAEEHAAASGYQKLLQAAKEHQQGKGDLWPKTNLEQGLKWEQQAQANAGWASRYGQHKDFALAMGFLRDSENQQQEKEFAQQERARQKIRFYRWATVTGVAVIAVLAGMALYAFEQKGQADARFSQAEASLLWSNLVFSERELSSVERETLWRLAAAEPEVKDNFAAQLLTSQSISQRYAVRALPVTRALVGLNGEYRKRLIGQYLLSDDNGRGSPTVLLGASFLAYELGATEGSRLLVEAIQGTTDSSQLSALVEALKAVAGQLSPAEAGPFAQRLLLAIQGTTNDDQLSALGNGLNAVAGRLSSAEAGPFAKSLLLAIQGPTNNAQRSVLGEALKAVAGQLGPAEAGPFAQRLLLAIQGPNNDAQNYALGKGLKAVAGQLGPAEAGPFAQRLLLAIQGPTNDVQLSVLGNGGLGAVAGRLSPAEAGPFAKSLLLAIQGPTNNAHQLSVLGNGLKAVAGRLGPAEAGPFAKSLLLAIQGPTNNAQLSALGEALNAVAGRLSPAEAGPFSQPLLLAIQGPTNNAQLSALGEALKAVAGRLSPAEAEPFAQPLLLAIQETTDDFLLSALGKALKAVAGQLSPAEAGPFAKSLLLAIQGPTNNAQLSALNGLYAVAGRLSPAEAGPFAQSLLLAIQGPTNDAQLSVLGNGLNAVAGRLSSAEAGPFAKSLLLAIQGPTNNAQRSVLGEALKAVAGQLGPAEAGPFAQRLLLAIQGPNNDAQNYALGKGLEAVAGQLGPADAGPFAKSLLLAIQGTSNDAQHSVLGEALMAVAGQLGPADAGPFAKSLLLAIQWTSAPYQRTVLGEALKALAGRLSPAEAGPFAKSLLPVIQGTSDPYQLSALGEALEAVAGKLSPAEAGPLAQPLLLAIQGATNDAQIYALGIGLYAVARQLSPAEAKSVTQALTQAMGWAKDATQRGVFRESLMLLVDKLQASEETTRLLFEILKNPVLDPKLETSSLVALRKDLADRASPEPGVWALVALAKKRYPGIDLSSRAYLAPSIALRGISEADKGHMDQALALLAEAKDLDPNLAVPAGVLDALCRSGALHRRAIDVLDFCNKAVALSPENGIFRDHRGLARALTGKTDIAIQDFSAYLDWGKKTDQPAAALDQRRKWIAELAADRDPFTPPVLAGLREQQD
jgi:hypothetical protein